jgi:uncharacterized RDD family membrane protein YckC
MQSGFDSEAQAWIRAWALILLASCAAAIAVVILVLWAMNGFHGLAVGGNALIALLLGTIGTVALSVALMGLVFYSNASQHDTEVRDLSVRPGERGRPGDPDG